MTFFAYQCQVQMLPIYSELVNPVYKRIEKVINRAIFVDFTFYSIIALIGFFSEFQDTPQIVLERMRLPGKEGPDVPILIAIIGICITIILAFPLSWNPTRQQCAIIFFKRETYTNKENIFLTVFFVMMSWLIALIYPQITKVISILGGLCATTLDFLIPTYCYL